MGLFLRTAQAEEDLVEIWLYIAADNPEAADKILNQIDEKCQIIAENPSIGQLRPELSQDLRSFPVGSYLILYQEQAESIEIVRIVHGSRNLPDLFE